MLRAPPRMLWFGFIRTAATAWLVIRLALGFAAVGDPTWPAALLVIVLAALGPMLDAQLSGERHVLESTGLHPLSSLWIGLPTAGLLECLAQVLA